MAPPRKRRPRNRPRRASPRTEERLLEAETRAERVRADSPRSSRRPTDRNSKAAVEAEPWSRKQLAVMVCLIAAMQPGVGALEYLADKGPLVAHMVVFQPPLVLACALLAMPLARLFTKARRMRFMETLAVGALLSVIAFFLYVFLVGAVSSPGTSSSTSTASPSPSASTSASTSSRPSPTATPSSKPTPIPTATLTPTPTSRSSSSPTSTVPTPQPTPLDATPGGLAGTLTQDQTNALVVSDVAAVLLTIWSFPGVYRFFWMPTQRAQRRAERRRAKEKSE